MGERPRAARKTRRGMRASRLGADPSEWIFFACGLVGGGARGSNQLCGEGWGEGPESSEGPEWRGAVGIFF